MRAFCRAKTLLVSIRLRSTDAEPRPGIILQKAQYCLISSKVTKGWSMLYSLISLAECKATRPVGFVVINLCLSIELSGYNFVHFIFVKMPLSWRWIFTFLWPEISFLFLKPKWGTWESLRRQRAKINMQPSEPNNCIFVNAAALLG